MLFKKTAKIQVLFKKTVKIQEFFKIESKFSQDELNQAKKKEASDPEKAGLNPTAEDNLQKSDDGSSTEETVPDKAPLKIKEKALEILKQKTGQDLSALKIFDIKAFASLLIFFMRSKKTSPLQEEAEGKMISTQDLEKILTDEELKQEFDQVDSLFDGDLKKYVIRKYPSIKDTLEKAGKVPFKPVSMKELLYKLDLRSIRLTAGLSKKVIDSSAILGLRFLAMSIVNAMMSRRPSKPSDEASPQMEAATSRERIELITYLRNLGVDEEILSSIQTTMVKVGKFTEKQYPKLSKGYQSMLKLKEIDKPKLKKFIDAVIEKVDELKDEKFLNKQKDNYSSIETSLKGYNMRRMEESLKPIIETMLKEYNRN